MLLCHCILTGTIPAVPEWAPSAECLLVLFALCWPNLALGGGHPGTSTCMYVLSWYLCNTLGSCDTGYRIPQNHWFQHKALCLGHRRTVCGVAKPCLQAGGGFISPHSPPPCRNLVCPSWWPLQVETVFSAASFPYLLWVHKVFGDRAFMGTCAEMSPGLWCSHNPVLLLSLRSVGLVQKDGFSGFGGEGGDWNGSDSGTLRFGTNLPKSVIVQ